MDRLKACLILGLPLTESEEAEIRLFGDKESVELLEARNEHLPV